MLPRSGETQIILFSATFPDHVRNFASKFAPNANKIELKRNELAVDSIRQFYMDCKSEEHKYQVLVSLYHLLTVGQSITFCQQRRAGNRIAQRMVTEGHKVASLHGAKEGSERDSIIDGFREGREKVLITTNVISRGINVLQVNKLIAREQVGVVTRSQILRRISTASVRGYFHDKWETNSFDDGTRDLSRTNGALWSQGYLDQLCS